MLRLISRNNNIPNYGGTINDASLIRYLEELRKRKIKIMLYPMIFLDIKDKPWRGHITGSNEGIKKFFNHKEGYKNFILHYANLAKDKIDAFVIGSELIGLTKVCEGNNFPAIDELIDLAKEVRSILGKEVIITYAADWSEYHHTSGGYYNLDKLWACDNIDVVGIDSYFPLTNSQDSDITIEQIKQGWVSGEGYDYYYEGKDKKPIAPDYAWKNIEYWWNNYHYNPDGTRTEWVPKMKKIWFTEFGFPSIDKSTNQPNVFYDPNCIDGGIPKYSSGRTDFSLQRKAIRATIEFWENSPIVEKMFLWAWDARPYPAWPCENIWRDSNLWQKGHYINAKLSTSSLALILKEICIRNGYPKENIIINKIDDHVEGLLLDQEHSIADVISLLRINYFFDIKSYHLDHIEFCKRDNIINERIDPNQITKMPEIEELTISNCISQIGINFYDINKEYKVNFISQNSNATTNTPKYFVTLPIIMSEADARILSKKILASSIMENKIIRFSVTILELNKILSNNILELEWNEVKYHFRVVSLKYYNLTCDVEGILQLYHLQP
ncbi:MAG UNVERIFIED_CONTAM: glycoside hydrolase TIM-barrel-like domain-containing protein [Rickettsiaceae bacterium]|jgi:hypothetical protein